MHKQRARHTARLWQMRQGNIIIHNHHADTQTKGAGAFSSKAEIQPITRVILDDQQTACLARHGQNTRQHRINRWAGKHLAAHCRRQHALPDKPRMAGFVP